MADRPGVQTATFAFTLPISCQICLGKVKQPVVCPNQHVFCQQCMDVWLMHNQQCPTCRVQISVDNPCKRVLGGLSGGDETSDRDSFSTKEVRKARLDVIFNEYEREIERLQSLVEDLGRKNEDLKQQVPNQVGTTGPKPQKGKGSDVDKLLLLTSKLQDATSTYEAVVRDMAKLKEENAVLREKNSDLSRMNDQLRMELNKRTPQKYGRFTVATLEAKVAQYEKENAQLQRALERSDQHTEDLEKQLENYKNNHNLQQEQRRSREKSRSKSPEVGSQEKQPADRKWIPVKFDHSKEHQASVSSNQTRHLPDPEVSPISQPLQFWRNPAGGNADLVPSWLRTDQHWPETDSEPAKASQHEQGSGDSFMLEKPSPLTPATCIRHLTIGRKTESLSQERKGTDTSYKTKDTSNRRAEESSHSSGSSHNSRVTSSNQHGESLASNNQSARSLSPERHSGESVTSSGKARRKLNLGTDGEKVRKSLFSPRETSKEEPSSGQYTSQDIRDTSSALNSLTDRDSTSSKTWNQHRFYWAEQILLGKNDQDLRNNSPDPREKSEHLVNRARSFPSEQLTKNFNSVVGKDRGASVGTGPSGAQAFCFHTRANLDGKGEEEGESTSQWLSQNGVESDDEDREVASKTANQSLLDLDITLTPNMKDVYMMMKQAERRVGERRKADGDLSYQRPPSCDARLQTRDYDVYKPVETSRNKTAHFEPKPRMPRSSSAPILDHTDLRNASSSNSVTEKPDASSKGRENRTQSSSLWQSNSSNNVASNVHIHDRGIDHGQKTYPAENHNMVRNRIYDGENTERHTKPSASSHPWAFRDTSSSFITAHDKPSFSRSSVTQEQTQAPEIKKPMHPTILECFGEGTSSGDRSRDSDIRGYQSGYKGMMDRETVGENLKKRKPRGSYSESPTKSPKWK